MSTQVRVTRTWPGTADYYPSNWIPSQQCSKLTQSYILIALSVCDVTVMLPVLHFLWQNRPLYITAPGWLTAGKCSSECIHEGILMRGKNGRSSRGEFPPITGHREKWRSEHRSTTVGWRAFGEEKNVCSSKKRTVYYCTWIINCRKVHWTQRKVTVRAPDHWYREKCTQQ
jgi:hypothetical protein